MQTSFFTDVIVRKPALLQAMLAFNGVTAPVAPPVPAWDVPGFDAAALGEGLARIRGANVLPWRRPSSVAEEGFWDFADESRRLAFVGAEEAERLGLTFGVCVHAPELARIIAREQVLALREELGESLYRYGIQRGQYQLGGVGVWRWPFAAPDGLPSCAGARAHGPRWRRREWKERRPRCARPSGSG